MTVLLPFNMETIQICSPGALYTLRPVLALLPAYLDKYHPIDPRTWSVMRGFVSRLRMLIIGFTLGFIIKGYQPTY